jgi:hypothetical protein
MRWLPWGRKKQDGATTSFTHRVGGVCWEGASVEVFGYGLRQDDTRREISVDERQHQDVDAPLSPATTALIRTSSCSNICNTAAASSRSPARPMVSSSCARS